jgi:gliding motility-associated-like protein
MICSNPTVYLDAVGVVSVLPSQIDGGSNDACGIVQRLINGNANQVYNCSNLGLNNVLLTATDFNTNSSSCNAVVTVADTVRPIARCRAPFSLYLNGVTGTTTLTPILVDSSSSDNCSVVSALYTINNQSSINYSCANSGSVQNITLRVFDGSNNFSTCSTTVTIRDTTGPVAQCLPSITRNLSSASPASVNVSAISLNNNSTDICGGAALTFLINGQPSFNFNCANIGPNTATLTVLDQTGNQSTCTSVVIINDITPPIASCIGNYNLNLDASGQANLTGAVLNNGSADNCGVSSFLVNGSATQLFTCSNFGSSAVTLTVRDASGNSSTCTSVITVQDTTAPIARCFTNPIEVYLNSSGVATVLGTVLDSLSTDNCIISTRLVNNAVSASFSCANVGLNNVTLTVRDQANNAQSCTATVFVSDTVLPSAICQNINAILNTSGLAFVNATAINASSTDNCIISSYQINGQSRDTFDCTNIGSNIATLTVVDNSGNESSCQSTISVIDNIAPAVSCTNRTVYLDASGSAIVPPNAVGSATDICGVVNYTIDNLPFRTYTCVNVNTTFADTIRAFDASGNPGICVAQITVSDTIRPVASCINRTISLDSFGVVTVTPSQINLNSTDNCNLGTLLLNNQPNITFNCNNVGNNTVTLRVADASGNFSTCSAQITIVDNIAPIARCRNLLTVQLDASGNANVQAINLDASPGSYDACAPLTYTVNGQSTINLNCSNLNGTNSVFLTVTDIHGNSSTCISNINVIDVNPPVISCTNYTLHLDITGNASLLSQNVINSALSTDNCNTISYTIDGSPTSRIYNCTNIGLNTVTVVGSDPSGNRDTCFASVTVIDTVAPTVNCQSIVVNLTYNVVDTLTLLDLGVSSIDACGVDTTVFFPNIITCANLGTVPINITSFDIYGNSATCISQVNVVLDGAQPSALDSFLCEGQPLQLYANPPATGFTYDYVWAGPGFSSNTQNPQIGNMQGINEGSYIVTIIPQGLPGCVVSDTVYIDVNVVPPPQITMDGLACVGDSITFYFANQSAYSGTNFTYQWFYEGIPAGTNNNSFTINPIAFSDTGSYSAVIIVDGCTDTSLVPLDLNVFSLPDPFTPTANSPCLGDTLNLFANPPTSSPYVYSWSGPIAFSSTSRDPLLPFALTNNSGIYQVTITDQNTCQRTASVTVTVKEIPDDPFLVYNNPLCINDILVLNDTVTRDPNTLFIWDELNVMIDTTTTPDVFLPTPVEGEYGVFVIENGCLSQRVTVDVVFELEPGALEDAYNVPFRDSLRNLEVTLNDAVRAGYSISIADSANHGIVSINSDGTLNYVPGFNYQGIDSFIYAICDPVCQTICDSAVVLIDVQYGERCFIPNALSPNGDGINDELLVVCRELFPLMKIQIYSRWGNLVFQGEPNGWNGMYDGANLPDGAYFYVLDFGDGSQIESGYLIISR